MERMREGEDRRVSAYLHPEPKKKNVLFPVMGLNPRSDIGHRRQHGDLQRRGRSPRRASAAPNGFHSASSEDQSPPAAEPTAAPEMTEEELTVRVLAAVERKLHEP